VPGRSSSTGDWTKLPRQWRTRSPERPPTHTFDGAVGFRQDSSSRSWRDGPPPAERESGEVMDARDGVLRVHEWSGPDHLPIRFARFHQALRRLSKRLAEALQRSPSDISDTG
jgi:hypothetical protein